MSHHADLRLLPSIDRIKQDPQLESLIADLPDALVAAALRETVDHFRQALLKGMAATFEQVDGKLSPELIAQQVRQTLGRLLAPSLVPVFNASGVVVHTNLGRAPIGQEVWQHMAAVATGYSNLEYDLEEGARGSRHQHFEAVLSRLVGAPACVVVNNNAAAVLLVLTALARGREVIVSRSELVEIGGSFRIPDIMAQGGAVLREVGTTNRTWLKDYEAAIGSETGLLMKAHRSNFALSGFTHETTRKELVALANQVKLPYYEDLGSGLIADLSTAGIPGHDQVKAVLDGGAHLVSFSGDKMLGGPQAGIVVGAPDLIAQLKRHPLTRALRPDKMTLAALEAVALAYLRGTEARDVPVVGMLTEPASKVRTRARNLIKKLPDVPGLAISVCATDARVGGGAEPHHTIPSAGLELTHQSMSENDLEAALRGQPVPIIGRIEDGRVVLDLRTILPHQHAAFQRALTHALDGLPTPS